MNAKQLGIYLSLSQPTIRKLIKQNVIPVINIGGIKRFKKSEVDFAMKNI
ncbi:MAG: helix-turn-helix domain-containing protein [Lactobacillaceae bacterium]|jgi:excisionase family DNA binding protein|nr:helix-turn-helix domain-containing protein [Lactobacillaceae bacterium]